MNFVASSIYRKAYQLALSEGLSPDAVQHDQDLFQHTTENYLPIKLLWEVYEAADQYLAPGFGLRFGLHLSADDYGTLGLSWKTAWTARDILERTQRYLVLITNWGTIRMLRKGEGTYFYILRRADSRGLAISNETSFAMFQKVMQEVTAVDIHPLEVHFQHRAPANTSRAIYQDYFHCPVSFEQTENYMYFRNEDLDIPTLKADRSIHQFLVERMEEEAAQVEMYTSKLLQDVQRLIEETLPSGIPSMEHIGKHLGMSKRTLQRRLAEQGFNFRELVQQTQIDLSTKLLRNSNHSVGEIAFQSGYAEQSAFNRAFKRWTGQAPIAYRKA